MVNKIKRAMKELSIEEKSRRYDEAIKIAEALYKKAEPMSGCNVILEKLFPELKKFEDEEIRKALIRYFTLSDEHAYNEAYGVSYRDIVAWLERQCERKPVWNEKDENEVIILKAYIHSKDWSDSHIDRALGIVDELVKKLKSLEQGIGE